MSKVANIFVLLSTITFTLHAAIPPGQWQCLAFDTRERNYQAFGMTLKEAMQAAKQRCQHESGQRACKVAQSYCEQGPLSLIDDRCIVTDESGRAWNATGKDACRTATALCTEWQFLHGNTSQCVVKHR